MINHERQEQYDFAKFGLTCFAVGFFLGVFICIAFLDSSRDQFALERHGCVQGRITEKGR